MIDSVARQNTQMIPMPNWKVLEVLKRVTLNQSKQRLQTFGIVSQPREQSEQSNGTDSHSKTWCLQPAPFLTSKSTLVRTGWGFLSRWAVMYCQRERTDPDPVEDTRGKDQLIDDLIQRVGLGGWMVRWFG